MGEGWRVATVESKFWSSQGIKYSDSRSLGALSMVSPLPENVVQIYQGSQNLQKRDEKALVAQRCQVPTHMRRAVMLTVASLPDAETEILCDWLNRQERSTP